MAEEKSRIGKVVEGVKDAASAVAHAVQPVGKALGLVKKEKQPKKEAGTMTRAEQKAARRKMIIAATVKTSPKGRTKAKKK